MRRLQTLALLAMLAGVLVLLASLVLGLRRPAASEPASALANVDGERLRVEVLNGAGVPGLARTATRRLRARNFDVVYFGNAPGGLRDSSVVIDRVGSLDDARRVADALGIEVLRTERDTSLYLEATVVLGRDWAGDAAALNPSAAQ